MKQTLYLDLEVYRNYFLAKFKSREKRTVREYELVPGGAPLNVREIRGILKQYRIVTFNGINYDMCILALALTGADNAKLKRASDWIITLNMRPWDFEKEWGVEIDRTIDHIDLIEVAFGQGSLKLYGGRLHSRKLQDLPIEPDASIAPAQRPVLRSYCGNDLDTTGDLFEHLHPHIEVREIITAQYGVDVRSKSDAQIAEAVIRSDLEKVMGYVPKAPLLFGERFTYKPPRFIQFATPQLQRVLDDIVASEFVVAASGAPVEPEALAGRTVTIGQSVYRLGIGGLHSSEQSVAHVADEHTLLLDRDVRSYYPSIILLLGLFPEHLTPTFLDVYRSIYDRRLKAKDDKDTVTANVLKIVLNGSFGKFGSMYSRLYSPNLLIQVTVTGQLALLMLIEWLESRGIRVVSANTDGIVIKCARSEKDTLDAVVGMWEARTGFVTEETLYKALYSRDVNNYLALKAKGGVKGKGAFGEVSISKNPTNAICNEAVAAFLEHGTPIEKTIRECTDIRKFVTVRTVKGGAIKITRTNFDDGLTPGMMKAYLLAVGWEQVVPGALKVARFARPIDVEQFTVEAAYREHCGADEYDYIGKVVRWYYAEGETGALHYKATNASGNRNKVPNSDGARPLMELPDEFPDDVDHEVYIAEARSILKDIGWKFDVPTDCLDLF
jgi:hypothetical protein